MGQEELERRIAELEARLGALEQRIAAPAPPPRITRPPADLNVPTSTARPASAQPMPAAPPRPAKPPVDMEALIGRRLLPAAGAVAMMIGIYFLVSYAIAQGWITPVMQFTGELVICAAFLALGAKFMNGKQQLGEALLSVGLVGAYMSFSGAFYFKQLYGWETLTWLWGGMSVAALGIALWRRAWLFQLFAILGAFVTAIMPLPAHRELSLILLTIAFSVHAGISAGRGWRPLVQLSWTCALAGGMLAVLLRRAFLDDAVTSPVGGSLLWMSAVYFPLLALAGTWLSQASDEEERPGQQPFVVSTFLVLATLLSVGIPRYETQDARGWAFLAAGVAVIVLAALSRRSAAATGAAVSGFLVGPLLGTHVLTGAAPFWVSLAVMASILAAAEYSRRTDKFRSWMELPLLLGGLSLAVGYIRLAELSGTSFSTDFLALGLAFAALLTGLWQAKSLPGVGGFAGFLVPPLIAALVIRSLFLSGWALQFASDSATFSLFCFVVGLGLACLVTGALAQFLKEASSLSSAGLCLMLAGGLLAIGTNPFGPELGWQISPDEPKLPLLQAAAMLAGCGGLWALWLQLDYCRDHLRAWLFSLAGVPSAVIAGMGLARLGMSPEGSASVAWTLYAVFGLAVGFIRKDPALRWIVLGLFASIAAKVMLVDLANLETPIKIIVFMAFGAVLLVGGYFYIRLTSETPPPPPPPPPPEEEPTQAG